MQNIIDRLYTPTPVAARKIGDGLLLASTVLAGIAAYAACPICTFLAGLSGVVGKFLTNLAMESR